MVLIIPFQANIQHEYTNIQHKVLSEVPFFKEVPSLKYHCLYKDTTSHVFSLFSVNFE